MRGRYDIHYIDRFTKEDKRFGWSNEPNQLRDAAALMPYAESTYVLDRITGHKIAPVTTAQTVCVRCGIYDPERDDSLCMSHESEHDRMRAVLESAVYLAGGWREAIVELEDWCHEPVRLKNMIAAADQIDEFVKQAREALRKNEKANQLNQAR